MLKIHWRTVLPFLALNVLTIGGVIFIMSRPACQTRGSCAWIVLGVSLLLSSAGVVVLVMALRRPIEHLKDVLQRIEEGENNARMRLSSTIELSNLFNRVFDRFREEIVVLDEERQRFAAVLVHMADGVIITDPQGRVRLINPAATHLLKTTLSEAQGRSFAEVAHHYQLIDLWQQSQREATEQTAAVEIDRQGFFVQASVSPFHEENKSGFSCLILLQDLTRIRRLETVRRDFISNVSHELRTPIASLKVLVETLQDGAMDDPPAAQRFLRRAETEVDTMTQIVEELLTLSRIESGQVPLRLAATAVSDIFMSPIERLLPLAQRKEIELILDLPFGLPYVLADLGQIQQVVTNLVHNAIKHTPEGGSITLSAKVQAGREVVLAVKDTGIGISKEDLPRIFERFYKAANRARQREPVGGTGLGLAIAKHIIQAHEGRIWAKSKEGKGSTFYFALPIANGRR